ncbi:hypothetical protein DH2020_028629 [Rehmannia glutinosa]|uniref:Uncharacterized protein n=1 Tax=Rehmannia glutinosa TaxID=99300 RepID=A0ABR0VSS9_REHGL
MSAKRKLFTAHGVGELDLNKALPDESSVPSKCTSSCVSHNEVGEYGKSTFLIDLDWREPKNNHSNDSSSSDRQDITRSTLTTSPSKDPSSCSMNLRPKNAESEISLPDKTRRKISTSKMNVDKNKEDQLCSQLHTSQEFLEGTGSNRSPVSCKSYWTADDVSSNTKTGQCGVDIPNSNPSIEMKLQSSDSQKKESDEVDITVRKGAVSLIYFSSESFARKRKENCNLERETPQSSSESYESIVLKQQECSVDEYCVSSTPSEATSPDKKDHGVKLKRGRRMKDFRKDILPGLPSLSRQEISEDIKIMELAFRSREYKKYRPKNASRSDCFSSVRSRRSRLSCVGRRY